MNSVPEIIEAFGGNTAFGKIIGKRASTASEMKRAKSIPSRYWVRIVDVARARRIPGITFGKLAELHSRGK